MADTSASTARVTTLASSMSIPYFCSAIFIHHLRSDDVVDAAWEAGIGVHALIWVCSYSPLCQLVANIGMKFGFDGGNEWQTRRDSLISSLTSNPKAKFVTRGVQFGSEPLFDNVLPHEELASQVLSAKSQLSGVGIPVTVSELADGYQERGGAQDVLDAIDFINIHMLPFFSGLATSGGDAWPLVETDMNWFIQQGGGKKMYFDEASEIYSPARLG